MMHADESRAAALRLKHDLGKPLRFNAPASPEAAIEPLRERLRRDLVSTRVSPEGVLSAGEVWDDWLARHGKELRGDALSHLDQISLGMEDLRREVPRLESLDEAALRNLDALTRTVQEMIFRMAKELSKA